MFIRSAFMRSWLLPVALLLPLAVIATDAWSCIRFKAPGGSVSPGMREPSDPPETPPSGEPPTPTTDGPTPVTPTTPAPTGPVTAPSSPTPTTGPTGEEGGKKGPAIDNSTWETWWELNRVEFFPRRWVGAVISPENGQLVRAGPQALHADVVERKIWPLLEESINHKHVFVRESALITMGRVAANETQRARAREVLLERLKVRNHLEARSAALGLFYVADETSIHPMYMIARDEKTDEDTRAFLALTMTNLKHPLAAELLKQLADVRKGYFELVGSAIMGLGYNGIEDDPSIPEFLTDIAYKQKNVRAQFRALAVESFGRIGDLEAGFEPIYKGLSDRDIEVRRSSAIAAGVLDYRTPAEREILSIRAPYEEFVGVPMTPVHEAQIRALEAKIPEQRLQMVAQVKKMVKRLGEAMQQDNDTFTRRMSAISLGRIYAQNPQALAAKYLDGELKDDKFTMREFALLAKAIGGMPGTLEQAQAFLKDRNPSTRGAGCIALGLICNKDRADAVGDELRKPVDAAMREIVAKDPHPFIRGYAAIGLGLTGTAGSADVILETMRSTRTPECRAYCALGLALLGTKKGADDLVAFIGSGEMRNGFVASHMVYSLGLTKDRRETTLDTLVEVSRDKNDQYVQAAALAAIGYVSSGEFYPLRHLMARGYNFMLNMDYIDTYFYKL